MKSVHCPIKTRQGIIWPIKSILGSKLTWLIDYPHWPQAWIWERTQEVTCSLHRTRKLKCVLVKPTRKGSTSAHLKIQGLAQIPWQKIAWFARHMWSTAPAVFNMAWKLLRASVSIDGLALKISGGEVRRRASEVTELRYFGAGD
jgi:hypothetical protein